MRGLNSFGFISHLLRKRIFSWSKTIDFNDLNDVRLKESDAKVANYIFKLRYATNKQCNWQILHDGCESSWKTGMLRNELQFQNFSGFVAHREINERTLLGKRKLSDLKTYKELPRRANLPKVLFHMQYKNVYERMLSGPNPNVIYSFLDTESV